MKRRQSRATIDQGSVGFAVFRVPPGVIFLAVRWHLRYGLSCRDLEDCSQNEGSRSTTSPCTRAPLR
jgi:transposase-like protein